MVTPAQLAPADFGAYPPLAKQVAVEHLNLLRDMPVPFLALLLREVIGWDWKFPAERDQVNRQFVYLASLSPEQRHTAFTPFAALRLSPQLEQVNWVNDPASFSEQLSAHLWSSRQIDFFHSAALSFMTKVNEAVPEQAPPMQRLAIVALGQGVQNNSYPLFRKLRQHGTYFRHVTASNGLTTLVDALASRAHKDAAEFAHWYIDGASIPRPPANVTSVSYDALTPVRARLQDKMRHVFSSGTGPEAFRSLLARMQPQDLGMDGSDPVLSRFELSLLTEGSGTQVFSTTFVQWAAREALRRAQPLTLLARFTPRQQERPMSALLMEAASKPAMDPRGSLIDADMAAYYTWINQQRLSGAAQAAFVAWFEPGGEAIAVGPKFSRGSSSSDAVALGDILQKAT
ncbi:MAG: hypothetical protein JO270_15065 [Acidobacteriaceae bacterium]|nr:hypothetical protein [Acidobacteriaceae bacterium]